MPKNQKSNTQDDISGDFLDMSHQRLSEPDTDSSKPDSNKSELLRLMSKLKATTQKYDTHFAKNKLSNWLRQALIESCDRENRRRSDLLKYCLQVSGEQIQEDIQSVNLLRFDTAFVDLECINVQNKIYKAGDLSDADVAKIKVCIDKFRTASSEQLVTSNKSKQEDIELRQMLKEYGLRKELLKIKTQNPLLKDLLSRYSENAEIHEKFLHYSALAETDPSAAKERDRLEQDIKNLRGKLQISFVDFLILINHEAVPENIFKYIDFLNPEYFEWHRLVEFVYYAISCKNNFYMICRNTSLKEIPKTVDNFINKITIEHILLMQHGVRIANKPDYIVKEFIEKICTFEQLALFWYKSKIICQSDERILDDNQFSAADIESVRSILLKVISYKIEHDNQIDFMIKLCDTHQNIAMDLLKEIDRESLLCIHYYLLHTSGEIFDECKEGAKKNLGDAVVKRLNSITPENILKLLHDKDYYAFARCLPYETISKILHIFNNPSEYIGKYVDRIYITEHILSDDKKHKFVLALNGGLQNGTLLDKSQKLKDLIERETKKYKSDEAKLEVVKVKILQDETDVSCDDEADKEKRECASSPLDNACSKLNTSALNESEGQKHKSDETELVVDSVEALHGAVGASCNDGENIEKIDSSLSVENDDMVFVEKFFGLDIFRM